MSSRIVLCAMALGLVGCSDDVRLRGSLGEGWELDGLAVRLGDEAAPVPIPDGVFDLRVDPAERLELHVIDDAGTIARLDLEGLPAGASLNLERIRPERLGRAFPAQVRLGGTRQVEINGIRMADPRRLPRRVEATGSVLAIRRNEQAMLVRPADAALPDLPVLLSERTLLLDADGDSIRLRRFSPGDSVRLELRLERPYYRAERVVLIGSRERSGGGAAGRGAAQRAAGSGGGDGARRAREAQAGEARDGPSAGRSERGRDAGAGARIPPGHRPPPGQCRDWDPSLPPGQQRPPRPC
jgi:hypothetical protein